MTRFIALPRATDLGGRTTTMRELRDLFGSLGIARVVGIRLDDRVAIGDDRFDARALERRIEARLHRSPGCEGATFRGVSTVALLAATCPPAGDGRRAGEG